MKFLARWLIAVVCGACGASQAAQPRSVAEAPQPAAAVPSTDTALSPPEPAPVACIEPPAAGRRDAAIDAMLGQRAREAEAIFQELTAAQPGELASALLVTAANRQALQANLVASVQLGDTATQLASFERTAARSPSTSPAADSGSTLTLQLTSQKKNLITDDADWLTRHQLEIPVLPPVALPTHVAESFRNRPAARLFPHGDHIITLYGASLLVVSAPGKLTRAFELPRAWDKRDQLEASAEAAGLELNYAQLVGDTLLLQLSYNGYAAASAGLNGYIAAYDARNGALLWRSDALVANAGNFVVWGDAIVTGYGFTDEPDFLFQLDLGSGAVRQKLPLRSGPSYLIRKGDQLHVRTYDIDYVFGAQRKTAQAADRAVPPATLAAVSSQPTAAEIDARMRCLLRTAAAAMDARDLITLRSALAALQRTPKRDPHLLSMLTLGLTMLEDFARGADRIDVWNIPPVRVAPPPWRRMRPARTPPLAMPRGPAPRLMKLRAENADPVRTLVEQPYAADQAFFLAPVDNGALPAGARTDIPASYGGESLRAVIPSNPYLLLIYGGRYLLVLDGPRTVHSFDLEDFRNPPRATPQWKEFSIQDATYAQLHADTLYVCNGGGSYAREVFGKKGFVSAIDVRSGQLQWRSDALACNASFARVGEYLVTGYGFTAEPDHAFVLRMSDGTTVDKLPLDSGPSTISFDGRLIHVEAYAHSYDLELR